MENKLIPWLTKELNDRGWSMRRLAQKAGLSHTQLSNVISGQRNITFDFCAAIAGPLGKQPEELFRLAGLLPPKPAPPPSAQTDLETKINEIYQAIKEARRPDRAPQINEPAASFTVASESPNIETLAADIWPRLDQASRQAVYDYARWRLTEQKQRRDSSGQRQPLTDNEAQQELIAYFQPLSPEERERLIMRLFEYLNLLEKIHPRKPVDPPAELEPTIPAASS
jgi:transcriptional regulator with XRE-family HTH domain